MTTPLPSTPGDQREDHAQAVADAVAAIYAQVELTLIATVAGLVRQVTTGSLTVLVAQQRLAHATRRLLTAAAPQIHAELQRGMAGASQGARRTAAATLRPEVVLQPAVPDAEPLAQLLDQAAATATASARDALTTAPMGPVEGPVNIFTPYRDVHREAVHRAIADTRGGAPYSSLSLSRIQAAQKALDDLAEQGVTGFVDRTGRRWDLTAYVEMATRTAVSNAWDQAQAVVMVRSGLDLVLVSTHSLEGSCPHCAPWLGRTVSLTGVTPGHPTLDEAKEAGFRHPNCRCFWLPFGAGIAEDVTNPVPTEQTAAMYKASQRQRALERKVREAGRRAHAAITPAARTKARRDLAAAKAASAEHRKRSGLRMMKVSVERREHPFQAH